MPRQLKPTPLTATRLLAVMPHPDDEAYSAAGTLALAAARGATVAVLCVTRGEAGVAQSSPAAGPATAAITHRLDELDRACAIIKATRLPSLNWPDGALADLVVDDAVAALHAVLLAWQPQVVLGLGADGVYGHTDHLALHGYLRAAVAGFSCLSAPRPALFEAVFPPGHFHPVWRGLRRKRAAFVPKGWTPQDFGSAPRDDDVVVQLQDAQLHDPAPQLHDPNWPAQRKRAAIAAHASQLGDRSVEDFLRPGLMLPLLRTERWRAVALP